MPIPLIPVIVGGGTVLVAGGIAWYYWPKIKKVWTGSSLLLVGERTSGKTSIAHLMAHDCLPPNRASETKSSANFKVARKSFKNLSVSVGMVTDVPGNEEAKESKWKDLFNKSDYVFYLVRADYFLGGNQRHIERVKKDMKSMKRWLADSGKSIVVVATHSDKVSSSYGNISDALSANEDYKVVASIINPKYRKGLVVGSLATVKSGRDLVYRALKEVV